MYQRILGPLLWDAGWGLRSTGERYTYCVEGWCDGAVRVEVVVGVDGERGGGECMRGQHGLTRRGWKGGGRGPGLVDGKAGGVG